MLLYSIAYKWTGCVSVNIVLYCIVKRPVTFTALYVTCFLLLAKPVSYDLVRGGNRREACPFLLIE